MKLQVVYEVLYKPAVTKYSDGVKNLVFYIRSQIELKIYMFI